jgi:uncharacterized membrane protein YphA (DoxX/SURF4 family)
MPPTPLDKLTHWLARLGLAGIFLSNSLGAWYDASSYMDLMRTSFMGRVVSDLTPLVTFVRWNDLAVGLLVLLGLWPKYVWAWAGMWLILATLVRFSAVLFPWA